MAMAHTVNISRLMGQTAYVGPPRAVESVALPASGVTRANRDTPIGETGWKLALDLGVQLEYSERVVIAASPWVDDYAVGENEQDALRNLLLSLVDFRESLERRTQNAQLSDELTEVLARLRLLLKK